MRAWVLQQGGTPHRPAFANLHRLGCRASPSPLPRAQWSKFYAATLINRVNSVNGRVYKDDPTIM